MTKRISQSGPGDRAVSGLDPAQPVGLAIGGLVEPLRVGGLLGGRLRNDLRERLEERDAPRVLQRPLAGAQGRPLDAHGGPSVTDQLAGEQRRLRLRQELSGLVLLDHVARLALSTAERRVVRREREEHDEPEQHREPGREHAEDSGRAVAVVEEPACRRVTPAMTRKTPTETATATRTMTMVRGRFTE